MKAFRCNETKLFENKKLRRELVGNVGLAAKRDTGGPHHVDNDVRGQEVGRVLHPERDCI